MFPEHVAERLKNGESVVAEAHECVTVLFSDIVGFTRWAMRACILVCWRAEKENGWGQGGGRGGGRGLHQVGDARVCEFCLCVSGGEGEEVGRFAR